MLPRDPMILLSYLNTKLRDDYPNLDALCGDLDVDKEELLRRLETVNYTYDAGQNRLV